MNRGYKNYEGVEPYNDGWGYTAHSGTSNSDHVCRPVIVDADGRKQPIIQYASGTGGYVMKTERIVEYRYSPDEPLADYRGYGKFSPVYDSPQGEASIPVTKVSGPFTSNWHTRTNPAGQDHGPGTKNYADDSNGFQDKQSEAYPKFYGGTDPVINKDMYPSSNHGPTMRSHPLSKPTNDIGTAMDFLTKAINPNYATNAQTDVSRPSKAGPLSSIHWRPGSNSAAQDSKMDSDEDEPRMYGRDEIPNFRKPTKPINNKESYERANGNGSPTYFGHNPAPFQATSQQQRFPAPTTRNRKMSSPPETIDSTEARKRYGNLKNQSVPDDANTGTIDSNGALIKYNGAKVPW